MRAFLSMAHRVAPSWVREVLWAVWLVLLGMLVINWHRLALVPSGMNPAHGVTLASAWLVLLALAAWWVARLQRSLLPLLGLAIAGVLAVPPDLWSLGAAAGLCLGLACRRPSLAWTGFALLALGSLWGAYERIFGPLSAETSSTLAQTAPAEAGFFLLHLVTPGWLVNQLALGVTLALAIRATPPQERTSGPTPRSTLLLLLLALPAASPGLLQRAMAMRDGLEHHRQHVETVEEATPPAARIAGSPALDVIWVIGESQARPFWQLYGYPRETTPELAAFRDELVVMTDAVSPHSYTVQSLMEAAYRRRLEPDGGAVSLLALLRSAGVQVQWHTAQEHFGPWASPIVRWASGANSWQQHGSHLRIGLGRRGEHPDRLAQSALLQELAQSADGHRLLVHHMFAAHDPYCAHAPPKPLADWRDGLRATAWFGRSPPLREALHCYEGAVRFTDAMLARYARVLRDRSRPGVLVFLPDHGEDPAGGTGHNADRPSLWHLEIPVVLYANAAAREALGPVWSGLAAHAAQPFLGSWVYELMLELFGVAAPELVLRSPPRAADTFRAPARVVYPQGRRWDYDDASKAIDLLSATRNALARRPAADRERPPLYAHRVNTVLKAMQAMRDFDGIEFDIVFDPGSRELLVNHPPMPVSGLRVSELLEATSSRPGLRLWLDFKNPEQSPDLAVRALRELDAHWRIRDRTVLEVPANTPEAIKAGLSRDGWAVSLYLPESFAACAAGTDAVQAACAQRAKDWVAEARRVGLTAFSFDDALRPAVQRHLRPLAPERLYLSWKLSLRADDSRVVDAAADLAPLDALIVSFPSPFSP
jgi:hypothetical protein